MRCAAVLTAALAAGCGGEWEPGADGTLAYVDAETGALVAQDVETGEVRVLDEDGEFASVALSADARRVAYIRASDGGDSTRVRVVGIEDREVTEIHPDIGGTLPDFRWGRAGWLMYAAGSGGSIRRLIVQPGADTGASIGAGRVYRVAESPTDDRIAFADCVVMVDAVCDFDIVEQRADGTDRSVLATGARGNVAGYTRDGSALVTTDWVDDQRRILVRPLDGAATIDLGGAGDLGLNALVWLEGGSRISPDGTELIVSRDGMVQAERLDGGGSRDVVALYVDDATFTPGGAVIYEVSRNLDEPPDDTPRYVYSTYAVLPSGDEVVLRFEDPSCRAHLLSPDGELIAFRCNDAPIHRIATGELVARAPGFEPLGFTASGGAVVVAGGVETDLWLVPLDGRPTHLATYARTTNPRYDYAP